ncbi:MAG TPA: cellulase family glycosylhydrolase [Solirubrobacteraceae bacterium]|nr:cellulase family glycosylhydrolase [Solirubrobacteraceae bacterium]
MPFTVRPHRLFALGAVLFAGACAWSSPPALASTNQISIMEPGPAVLSDPAGVLHTLQLLGVNAIRLNISWGSVAPDANSTKAPKKFNASQPGSYSEASFAPYDAAVQVAHADGITVEVDVAGGTPAWAFAPGTPKHANPAYAPTDSAYQAFYEAVARRYDGHYTPPGASSPLPDVTTWAVWNEANYTASLKPQSSKHGKINVPESPEIYRGLAAAAWKALSATGHAHNKVLLGELTARGYPNVGYGGMYPIVFVQSLYCLGSNYKELRGTAASEQGCPTTAAASRKFRSQNPALFGAAGISSHPYSRWYPPNSEKYSSCNHNSLCASLGDISDLVNAIAKVQSAYGSHYRPAVYDTEYGYKTSPPLPVYFHNKTTSYYNVPINTATEYLNWAEYISWKNPQIASYDQYLLADPPSDKADGYQPYASGLELTDGQEKQTYDAFLLPLFLPSTKFSAKQKIEVWGDARPAHLVDVQDPGTSQTVQVQFEAKGSSTFKTLATEPITNSEGYFDTHMSFPGSGTVRLSYTYPASDMQLAPGTTAYSRYVSIIER